MAEGRAPLLLGFGNPTVDATVEVSGAELEALGIAAGADSAGQTQAEKERVVAAVLGRPPDTVELTPGGAALNSLRVAASVTLGRRSGREPEPEPEPEPLRVAFLGSVGRDPHAAVLKEAMAAAGVEPLLMEVEGTPTGICASLVHAETKDRALAVVRGAAGAMEPAFLEQRAVASTLAAATLTYCTSFVLSTPPRAECAQRLAQAAAEHGGGFALNLSSAGILTLPQVLAAVRSLLPSCRFIFGNTDELRSLAALLGWGDSADPSLANKLAAMTAPDGAVVITAGAEPTIVAARETTTDLISVPPVPQAEIVDTNVKW